MEQYEYIVLNKARLVVGSRVMKEDAPQSSLEAALDSHGHRKRYRGCRAILMMQSHIRSGRLQAQKPFGAAVPESRDCICSKVGGRSAFVPDSAHVLTCFRSAACRVVWNLEPIPI